MAIAIRRTESIKFGEFMSGGYKHKAEVKKSKIKPILKVATTATILITVSKTAIPAIAVTLPIVLATKAIPAMAASSAAQAVPSVPVGVISETVKSKIIHAFDPLVDLMVNLSYPIAGLMITGGCLMILIGQKDHGYKLIFNAAIGYILIQLSPMLINLLYGIGTAI